MNKEIEMLYKTIEAKDKIINDQVLEIARLKEKENKYNDLSKKRIGDMSYEELFTFTNGLLDETWNLEDRIEKAIEYIGNVLCNSKAQVRNDISGKEIDNLIEILEDKENE